MNLEKIFKQSLEQIKSKWELPTKGLLSGGSLANVIWENISGNKAVINDIDIYQLDLVEDDWESFKNNDISKKQSFQIREKVIYESYSTIASVRLHTSSYYVIEKVSNEGIFNIINYKSNTKDPSVVIDSFDLNCCQVGYDLESEKFYCTKAFEEFLKTGEIKLVNLTTPSHSVIRMFKKKKELNCEISPLEIDLVLYTYDNSFNDLVKLRFLSRYKDIFLKYQEDLESYFSLERDKDIEEYILQLKNENQEVYYLKPRVKSKINTKYGFYLSTEFIFYMRNIIGNSELETLYDSVKYIFDTDLGLEKYFDCKPSEEEFELINNLCKYAPNCSQNLKGFTLSKQLSIIKKLLKTFEKDPFVAITILENIRIEDVSSLDDEMNVLLLELSIRKNILDDSKNKVFNILKIGEERKNDYLDMKFPF